MKFNDPLAGASLTVRILIYAIMVGVCAFLVFLFGYPIYGFITKPKKIVPLFAGLLYMGIVSAVLGFSYQRITINKKIWSWFEYILGGVAVFGTVGSQKFVPPKCKAANKREP